MTASRDPPLPTEALHSAETLASPLSQDAGQETQDDAAQGTAAGQELPGIYSTAGMRHWVQRRAIAN